MDYNSEDPYTIEEMDSYSARKINKRCALQERHPLQEFDYNNTSSNGIANEILTHKKSSSVTEHTLRELMFNNKMVQRNLQSSCEKPKNNYRTDENYSSEKNCDYTQNHFLTNLQDQLKKKEYKKMVLEQEIIEKENRYCTFRPEINKNSKSSIQNKPLDERWKEEAENKQQRKQEAVQRQLQKEKEQIDTWRPKKEINAMNRKNMYDQSKKFLEMKKKKILTAVSKQEDEFVTPSFQPKLNKNYNSTFKMDSFIDRQNEFLQKKKNNKSQIEKNMNPKFKPKLNANSLRMIKTHTTRPTTSSKSKDLATIYESNATKDKINRKSVEKVPKNKSIQLQDNYQSNYSTDLLPKKQPARKSDKSIFTRLTQRTNSKDRIVADIPSNYASNSNLKFKRYSEGNINCSSVDRMTSYIDKQSEQKLGSTLTFARKDKPYHEAGTTRDTSRNDIYNYSSINDSEFNPDYMSEIKKRLHENIVSIENEAEEEVNDHDLLRQYYSNCL